jgi:hypothetical protein
MNLAPALLAVAVLVMAANQSASARSEESVHWQIVVLNDEVDVEATVRRLEASAGFASALRYTRAIKGFAAPCPVVKSSDCSLTQRWRTLHPTRRYAPRTPYRSSQARRFRPACFA